MERRARKKMAAPEPSGRRGRPIQIVPLVDAAILVIGPIEARAAGEGAHIEEVVLLEVEVPRLRDAIVVTAISIVDVINPVLAVIDSVSRRLVALRRIAVILFRPLNTEQSGGISDRLCPEV